MSKRQSGSNTQSQGDTYGGMCLQHTVLRWLALPIPPAASAEIFGEASNSGKGIPLIPGCCYHVNSFEVLK